MVWTTGFNSADPEMPFVIGMHHVEFPGWCFAVAFTPAGEAAGFRVSPDIVLPMPDNIFEGTPYRGWKIPTNGPALTRRVLRDVPLGEFRLAELYDRGAGFHRRLIAERVAPEVMERFAAMAKALDERPGRRGRAGARTAPIAALYVDAVVEGGGSVGDLAKRLHFSASTVRNLIWQCRDRGLLTPAPAGRAGGELTDKARDVLAQLEGND